MSDSPSIYQHTNSMGPSDLMDAAPSPSTSLPSSCASFSHYRIDYKPMPRRSQLKGIWDGYNTRDEFFNMHLR